MVYHNKCCVPQCISLCRIRHSFPNPSKDMERFNKWLHAVNNLELMEMDPKKVYLSKRLCHQHFEAKYVSSWSNKLIANAVPTKNLTGISSTGSNDMSDTPSTSTKSMQASTQSSDPDDLHIEIPDRTNSPNIIEGISSTGSNDMCDTPSTFTKSMQASTQSSDPDDLHIEIPERTNSPNIIEGISSTGINDMCDTPSTSTKSMQASTQSSDPDNLHIEITERSNSPNIIEGNADSELLPPYQLLLHTGIAKHTMTPRKRKMYEAMKQLRKKYTIERSKKKSFKLRLSKAEQFRTTHGLEENFAKLNNMASMLIQCQFRESNKAKNLRRFTVNEKLLALMLYKQSARSYSVLSKIFILPSKSTLTRLLAEIVGGPGINDVVFESLQELTAQMDSSEKYVALLFDEMAIMPSLHFNEHSGFIDGFEDVDENRGSSIADHVLVFMVRGLKKQWKAPISYHFSSKGGASVLQIKHVLAVIIQKLLNIGLKPITIICDQNNSGVINNLIKDTREKYLRSKNIDSYRNGSFEIENFKIYPVFDPPHLLKGLRNNLIKKDLCYTKGNVNKIAKWKHIEKLYETDNEAVDGLKVLPQLSDEHIYENKLKKMKVKHAAQIFSQRLAATLRLVSQIDSERRCGNKAEETADLLYFFDRLFDSVNGSNKLPDCGKFLRCGLSDTSNHLDFWNREALPLLDTMHFEKRKSRDQARPPSLKNWSFTIRNIKSIWGILKSEGFDYLLTRRLNQDPLENAFGQLRSFGAQNINPSSHQFVGSFKILIFNTALSFYKNSFNCEDDKCDNMFISLKKLFVHHNTTRAVNVCDTLEYPKVVESDENTFTHKLHKLATNYVAGYILKRIKKNVTCSFCKNCMFSLNYGLNQNSLISSREYDGFIRRLCYPTSSLVTAFYDIFKIIHFCLDEQPHCQYLVHQIEILINNNVNFEFLTCDKDEHKVNVIQLITKFTIKTIVHDWCKRVNHIIQGKSKLYAGLNKIKLQANKIRSDRVKKKNVKQPEHLIKLTV